MQFANGVTALADCSLAVQAGSFNALLGPSGCGKSTVLRLVAGLAQPSAGRVTLAGAGAGSLSYVFQDATLMPWANVFDNVWLPLRIRGVARAQAEGVIAPLLDSLGLAGFERAMPAELSGGMKMRVSIARALCTQPDVLLMDEPFAALDEITRQRLNADLLALLQQQRFTVLFVTHSVFEAVFLAQRVWVMSARPGRMLECIEVDAPYPRSENWRTEPRYAQLARSASAALERGYSTPGQV
jgi:NitT/TauT family transport system ATP-binding protein